jgi:hypothetical protein
LVGGQRTGSFSTEGGSIQHQGRHYSVSRAALFTTEGGAVSKTAYIAEAAYTFE